MDTYELAKCTLNGLELLMLIIAASMVLVGVGFVGVFFKNFVDKWRMRK